MSAQKMTLAIPDGVHFRDLRLARLNDGSVSFDWTPIERICQANGLTEDRFKDSHEDNVSGLIVQWYDAHRRAGGDMDPVAEDLIQEALAEESQGFSHAPGRA